jgi:hypothetical protein
MNKKQILEKIIELKGCGTQDDVECPCIIRAEVKKETGECCGGGWHNKETIVRIAKKLLKQIKEEKPMNENLKNALEIIDSAGDDIVCKKGRELFKKALRVYDGEKVEDEVPFHVGGVYQYENGTRLFILAERSSCCDQKYIYYFVASDGIILQPGFNDTSLDRGYKYLGQAEDMIKVDE